MKRNIPIYFDNAVIMSPAEPINGSSGLNRLKVGVFTKYGNRNGSYIKDDVAEMMNIFYDPLYGKKAVYVEHAIPAKMIKKLLREE